ncbi:MAG: Omp28 family outer membrane lipoprotein [Salibacteraceae bacterium]
MKRFFLFFIAFAFVSLVGCDDVDYPKRTDTEQRTDPGSVGGNVNTTVTKILIEDFTGPGCQGCPAAAVRAEELKGLNGDQLVVVGIHAGYFASPPGTPHVGFDFSTPDGEEYTKLETPLTEFPSGYVNRRERNGSIILKFGAWGGFIEDFRFEAPSMSIDLNVSYTDGDRKVDITTTTTALQDIPNATNLVVYLVEDNIESPQTFPNNVTQNDYLQRHVMREVVTNTWGEPLFTTAATIGESVDKEFNFTIPNDWNVDNMTVIAYVRDTDSEVILQVEEVYVK